MGRKSALSQEQVVSIERRHFVGGESLNSLAKEFGVNESTLRRKIKPNKAEAQGAAKSLIQLATEKAAVDKAAKSIADEIAELPIARQQIVTDLSRMLSNISGHLAGAAEYSAATAHRLAGIANAKVMEIDDASPLTAQSLDALKGVAALTELANKAAHVPLNLIAANKDTVQRLNEQAPEAPTIDPKKLSDGALEELLNARAQKRPDRACDVGDWAGESRTAAA